VAGKAGLRIAYSNQQNFVVLTEKGGREVEQTAKAEAQGKSIGVDTRKRLREIGPSDSGMAAFRNKFVKKN
jgi:hypothetical protein